MKQSRGLRIRSSPSLQSEEIGIVEVNGVITFIDEVSVGSLKSLDFHYHYFEGSVKLPLMLNFKL